MRQLHLVERDALSGHLVLATSDDLERFELAVDDGLRDLVKPEPKHGVPAAEPTITPREIQMRVRGGASAEGLAAECGASLDWVLRFAAPVLAERTRIADEARRGKARRSTTEGQTVVFGEAVDDRFTAHGIDASSVRWDAHRREDAQWVISAHWVGAQLERTAEWTFSLAARTVTPLDDTAADLLSDRPIHPVIAAVEPQSPPGLTLAPPLIPGLVAFPAMPDAHTGPLPRTEEVFDQTRFDDSPIPTASGAPSSSSSLSSAAPLVSTPSAAVAPPNDEPDPMSFDEPPLPMHVPGHLPGQPGTRRTNLGIAARNETEDEKAARATIPSWDDILLGVRRKHD